MSRPLKWDKQVEEKFSLRVNEESCTCPSVPSWMFFPSVVIFIMPTVVYSWCCKFLCTSIGTAPFEDLPELRQLFYGEALLQVWVLVLGSIPVIGFVWKFISITRILAFIIVLAYNKAYS